MTPKLFSNIRSETQTNKLGGRDLAQAKTVDDLLDQDGPFKKMFKGTLEAMLKAELTNHLGYSPHAVEGHNTGNSRNGKSKKILKTSLGEAKIEIPRDRQGTFEPQIIAKHQTNSNEIESKIITMYARGITTRDIQATLTDIYGINPTLISEITNKILPQITEWQARPLDAIYPFIFLDAIHFKVRDNGSIVNKAAYIVIGINCQGKKEVLGIWLGENESRKFWLKVVTDLKNRGVDDIIIACTDNLNGFEEASQSVFPKTINQLCIIHQIRNSLKYVASQNTKNFLRYLKKVYQAPT